MFPPVESVCLTCFGSMFLLLLEKRQLNTCSFLDSSNIHVITSEPMLKFPYFISVLNCRRAGMLLPVQSRDIEIQPRKICNRQIGMRVCFKPFLFFLSSPPPPFFTPITRWQKPRSNCNFRPNKRRPRPHEDSQKGKV